MVEPVESGQVPESSRTCFVIGPIGNRLAEGGSPERVTYEESLRVMSEVIEPACERFGLKPVRADTLARAGEITEQIFRRLHEDDIVIADLTGGNANVMYELGLRHTRAKLTIQIGEYSRLPFDVNTIRTIQFSRSAIGLITARDELIQVLEAGLAGEYDPVAATRIWNTVSEPAAITEVPEADRAGEDEAGERGFLDIMADAEEGREQLAPVLQAIGECMSELGELSTRSTDQAQKSDTAGRGMRGRLQVAARYAAGVNDIASNLEPMVERYVSLLNSVSEGNFVLIERMEANPEELAEGREVGMAIRQLAAVTRESMASLSTMVEAIRQNAGMARVLREPSHRLLAALDRFEEATAVIDEWDRRLQSAGIPAPPEGWQPQSPEPAAETGEPGEG